MKVALNDIKNVTINFTEKEDAVRWKTTYYRQFGVLENEWKTDERYF